MAALQREIELRLAGVRGQLSNNDRRILAFLEEHLDELAFHTAESIAQGTGVSRAAVVRFSRRLGYAGFAELRARARDDVRARRAVEDDDTPCSTPTLLMRKVQRDVEGLQLLPQMLGDRLEHAATLVAAASRTWLVAARETHGLALYLYRLLHHIRQDVTLVDPSFPDVLRDIGPDEVALACTFRPYARQTLQLLPVARAAGAGVVVVTDGYGHAFLDERDVVLAVPVESPTIFLSFTPALSTLEALAAYVARLDPDRTHQTLQATDTFVHAQRLMLEARASTGQRHPSPSGETA